MSLRAALIRRNLFIATIVTLASDWTTATRAADSEDVARVRRAVAYLDARQDAWFHFEKADRGEEVDKTSCVSCHTGMSYLLARPALTRFTAEGGPAGPQEKTIAEVARRVEHWTELDSPQFQLMYDFNDQKKVQSRGTEAVFNALILARDDAEHDRKAISEKTRSAFRHLWASQITEGDNRGSWDWLNFGLEPWEATGSRAFGASLAAIAVSSAPGYRDENLDDRATRGIDLVRDYLRRRFPDESLYNRLWMLEASTAFADVLSAEQKSEVLGKLLALQREDGGWALATFGDFTRVDKTPQSQDSDGYATGLATHVLIRAGSSKIRPRWVKGLDWIRTHQRENGSWPASSLNKQRDPETFVGKLMSDAATALAAQALAEAQTP